MKNHKLKTLILYLLAAAMTAVCGCATAASPPEQSSYEAIGGDWRSQRDYTEDMALNESLAVCFSPLDDGSGFAVYDSSDGLRLGSLLLNETEYSVSDISDIKVSDFNAGSNASIGLLAGEDSLLWFGYDPGPDKVWPEDPSGGFYFIGIDSAQNG